jgi:hypothetical protein
VVIRGQLIAGQTPRLRSRQFLPRAGRGACASTTLQAAPMPSASWLLSTRPATQPGTRPAFLLGTRPATQLGTRPAFLLGKPPAKRLAILLLV